MEGDKLKIDSKRPSAIFYLEGNRAYYYEEGLASPLSLEFGPDAISDLEVVSKKKIESGVQTFVNTNKISAKSIIILLSTTVTFDKDFPQATLEIEKNTTEFLELVPFEDYISKQSKFPGKTKVVAVNRQLCEVLKNSFTSLGFVVAGVYPLSFCLEAVPQLATNLDLHLILSKGPELRNFNLLPESPAFGVPKKEKKDNKRLYILLGVFAILAVVLLFVIYKFIILAPKPEKSLPVNTPTPMPLPTITQEIATPSATPREKETSSTQSAAVQ